MKKIQKLDSFHLKLIGMLTMLIDHIGAFLFQNVMILRVIGRISFVIFAFLLVESMRYGKHKKRYITILLSFEFFFSLIEYLFVKSYDATVFSILGLSALTIYLLDSKNKLMKVLALLPITYVIFSTFNFTFFKVEYGIYGLSLILGFYLIRKIMEKYSISVFHTDYVINSDIFHTNYLIMCSIFILFISLVSYVLSTELSSIFPNDYFSYSFQSNAVISILFILCYSGKRGYDSKPFRIFSYMFYPLHIVVLYSLTLIL